MPETPHNGIEDVVLNESATKLVIEATWAPKDPRDKLYDQDATIKQKAGSFVRIVGSFHPVLNLGIYAVDIIRRGDGAWLLMPFILIIASAVAIFNTN